VNRIVCREKLRSSLGDLASTIYFDDEIIDRSLDRTVVEISRYYPKKALKEYRIVIEISNEKFTNPDVGGTATLTYKPIEFETETVRNGTATTDKEFTRDTDFYLNYQDGEIINLSMGTPGDSYYISYDKKADYLDISDISSTIQKIDKVVCLGYQPEKQMYWERWNDVLHFPRHQMEEDDHIVIYYETPHTAPTISARGSYPEVMDEVMLLGAQGYSLQIKALQLLQEAQTDIDTCSTNITTYETYLTGTSDSAKFALGSADSALNNIEDLLIGTTNSAQTAFTAMDGYLGSADSALQDVGKFLVGGTVSDVDVTGSESRLDSGAALINQVNVGAEVAQNYARLAEQEVAAANAYITKAFRYNDAAEASYRQGDGRTDAAGIFRDAGTTYRDIAEGYTDTYDRLLTSTIQKANNARNSAEIAVRFLGISAEINKEFITKLKERSLNLAETLTVPTSRGSFTRQT
jgi:hypothetical protein